MNLERYPVISVIPNRHFEFFSVGPKGEIRKAVMFQEIDENYYNIAFGNWDQEKNKIDYDAISNNRDRDKILATIASIVIIFMRNNPNATIVAKGQISAKTRLYQMAINKHFHEISNYYTIEGLNGDKWELFKRDKNYETLSIKGKLII